MELTLSRSFKDNMLHLREKALRNEEMKQLEKDRVSAKKLLDEFEKRAEKDANNGRHESMVYPFSDHELDMASSAMKGNVVDPAKLSNIPRLLYYAMLEGGLKVYIKYQSPYDKDDYPTYTMYAAWAEDK